MSQWRVLFVLALGLASCRGAVVAGFERIINRVSGPPPTAISTEARILHAGTPVVDLHADTLLWGRDVGVRTRVGHVDLPRLREGGVAVQVFGIVTRVPVRANIERTEAAGLDAVTIIGWVQGWPRAALDDLTARAVLQARTLERAAAASGGGLHLVRTRDDLDDVLARRARGEAVIGGLLGIEGAHALEGDPKRLAALDEAGVRMVGLAHFFDNAFAGSAHGTTRGGLTAAGRTLLGDMEARGITLDLAHASPATIDDALARATRPPVVSHTGVRGTCDNPRNLSDEQVRAVARAGGVIGIGFWETAVCGTDAAAIVRAIGHVVALVGDRHVALGSDFDGAVKTAFDARGLPAITQALLEAGYTPPTIARILGGNALRVLRANLPAGAEESG